jgi:hypothetical protein
MKQREVQDTAGTRWVLVQAMSGISGENGDEAAARVENESGEVPVVCTPDGGARSVRIELPSGWEESVPDEKLVEALERARS